MARGIKSGRGGGGYTGGGMATTDAVSKKGGIPEYSTPVLGIPPSNQAERGYGVSSIITNVRKTAKKDANPKYNRPM